MSKIERNLQFSGQLTLQNTQTKLLQQESTNSENNQQNDNQQLLMLTQEERKLTYEISKLKENDILKQIKIDKLKQIKQLKREIVSFEEDQQKFLQIRKQEYEYSSRFNSQLKTEAYDLKNGVAICFDVLYPLPYYTQSGDILFGQYNQNRASLHYKSQNVQCQDELTSQKKIIFNQRYLLDKLDNVPQNHLYIELKTQNQSEFVNNRPSLQAWSILQVTDLNNQLISGCFRLPLYSMQYHPNQLYKSSLPYISGCQLTLRIGQPNSSLFVKSSFQIGNNIRFEIPQIHLKNDKNSFQYIEQREQVRKQQINQLLEKMNQQNLVEEQLMKQFNENQQDQKQDKSELSQEIPIQQQKNQNQQQMSQMDQNVQDSLLDQSQESNNQVDKSYQYLSKNQKLKKQIQPEYLQQQKDEVDKYRKELDEQLDQLRLQDEQNQQKIMQEQGSKEQQDYYTYKEIRKLHQTNKQSLDIYQEDSIEEETYDPNENKKKLYIQLQGISNFSCENFLSYEIEFINDGKIIRGISKQKCFSVGQLQITQDQKNNQINIIHEDFFDLTQKYISNFDKLQMKLTIFESNVKKLEFNFQLFEQSQFIMGLIKQQYQESEVQLKLGFKIPVYEKKSYDKNTRIEFMLIQLKNYELGNKLCFSYQMVSDKGIVLDDDMQPIMHQQRENVIQKQGQNSVQLNFKNNINLNFEKLQDKYYYNYHNLFLIISFYLLEDDEEKEVGWILHQMFSGENFNGGRFIESLWSPPSQNFPPFELYDLQKINIKLEYMLNERN